MTDLHAHADTDADVTTSTPGIPATGRTADAEHAEARPTVGYTLTPEQMRARDVLDALREKSGLAEDGAGRTERRVGVRVFIYVIGLHIFAAFVMLLFFLGQRHGN